MMDGPKAVAARSGDGSPREPENRSPRGGDPAQMVNALETLRVASTFFVLLYHAALSYVATPLRLTTNLRVLITLGHEIRRLCGAVSSLRASFVQAAEDLWIDMVTPYSGDVPDPEVKRQVTKVVGERVPAGRL